MTSSSKIWDRFAKGYSKKAISDPAAYTYKLEKTRAYLDSNTKVLEFGCGTGSTALEHAPRVKHILATDFSQKMIDIATEKAKVAGIKNVDFKKTTLFELPDAPGSYDVILGLSILHLMPNYGDAIKRCYDLLKPGGVFVSSSGCLASMWYLKPFLYLGSFLRLIPVIKFFSKAELEQQMESCGFKLVENSTPGKDKITCFLIAQK